MKFPSLKKKEEKLEKEIIEESVEPVAGPEVETKQGDVVERAPEKKSKFNFIKKKQSKEKSDKPGFFAGMIERVEKKQSSSSRPVIRSMKPKAFSSAGIKYRLKEYRRVLKITKKPTTEEFKTIVKASGLGIIIIGVIGFAIHMVVQTMQTI